MTTKTVIITLESVTCCDCGVIFGIEAGYRARLVGNGEWFYCTNGHRQHYTETREKQLERERDRARTAAEYARAALAAARDQAQAAENSLRTTKGHVTRLKKRAAAGQCPCCDKTFANVARHVAARHPEFEATGQPDPTKEN